MSSREQFPAFYTYTITWKNNVAVPYGQPRWVRIQRTGTWDSVFAKIAIRRQSELLWL